MNFIDLKIIDSNHLYSIEMSDMKNVYATKKQHIITYILRCEKLV